MCVPHLTHTHTCVYHIGERERDQEGEGAPALGFIFVLLIHLYRGSFAGFSSHEGFPG